MSKGKSAQLEQSQQENPPLISALVVLLPLLLKG